jgi:hypothetical protein
VKARVWSSGGLATLKRKGSQHVGGCSGGEKLRRRRARRKAGGAAVRRWSYGGTTAVGRRGAARTR